MLVNMMESNLLTARYTDDIISEITVIIEGEIMPQQNFVF